VGSSGPGVEKYRGISGGYVDSLAIVAEHLGTVSYRRRTSKATLNDAPPQGVR
jgi:hypothetical protein